MPSATPDHVAHACCRRQHAQQEVPVQLCRFAHTARPSQQMVVSLGTVEDHRALPS